MLMGYPARMYSNCHLIEGFQIRAHWIFTLLPFHSFYRTMTSVTEVFHLYGLLTFVHSHMEIASENWLVTLRL